MRVGIRVNELALGIHNQPHALFVVLYLLKCYIKYIVKNMFIYLKSHTTKIVNHHFSMSSTFTFERLKLNS